MDAVFSSGKGVFLKSRYPTVSKWFDSPALVYNFEKRRAKCMPGISPQN